MVRSNIDLEVTIKNGFRKCGLYPLNNENVDYTKGVQNHSEALAIKHEINAEIKSTEFGIYSYLNKIPSKLREQGINSGIIVVKICELKQIRIDIEIVGITIQSETYVINEKDSLLSLTLQVQYLFLHGGNI